MMCAAAAWNTVTDDDDHDDEWQLPPLFHRDNMLNVLDVTWEHLRDSFDTDALRDWFAETHDDQVRPPSFLTPNSFRLLR